MIFADIVDEFGESARGEMYAQEYHTAVVVETLVVVVV